MSSQAEQNPEGSQTEVKAMAERIRLIDSGGALRRAYGVISDLVEQLPETDALLLSKPALAAWRTIRDQEPDAYLVYLSLVQQRAGRHVRGLLEQRVGLSRAGLPTDNSACVLDLRALAGKEPPPRRWAIADWFGIGFITLLVGAAGIGKTLLAQTIASCLSIHRGFLGDVAEAHRVLFWACEDDADELHRRQLAIAKWLQVQLEAFAESLHIVPRVGMDNTLVSAEYGRPAVAPLLETLREQAGDLATPIVILDNVAQMFGINENDRHAVTFAMNAVLGALPGCGILLLAHPARAIGSEFSGSSAWEAVARTRLYLGSSLPDQKADPEEFEDDVRFLSRRKANYSARDWRRLTFQHGVLVPEEPAGGLVGMPAYIRQAAVERTVVAGLERLQQMNLDPTDSSSTERFLPLMLCNYKLNEGHPKGELANAMRRLMGQGKLMRVVVGQHSNRSPKYGLRAAP